jgi:hypothetical protein
MPETLLRQNGALCARAAGEVSMNVARRLDEATSVLMREPPWCCPPAMRKTNRSRLSFLVATVFRLDR